MSAIDVETIPGDLKQFRDAVETTLGTLRVEPYRLDAIKAGMPLGLHQAFDRSPAAVSRLSNNWDYVTGADFSGTPNMQDFYRGDVANWALLGQGINFERDLESTLHDRLLDFATNATDRTRDEIVLSPAGYGLTTLLRAVAAWFARERVGSVLYLRP